MRPLIVRCPCCGIEIDIDRESGKVVRTGPKPGEDPNRDRFEDAFSTVKRRQSQTATEFDKVKKDIVGREEKLEDVFRDAFRKVQETDDGAPPPNPFDMD